MMKKTKFHLPIFSVFVIGLMLLSSNLGAQEQETLKTYVYQPKTLSSMDQALETISHILNDKCVSITDTAKNSKKFKYKKAIVTKDGIELQMKSGIKMIYFSKLFGEGDITLVRLYHLVTDAKTGEKYRDYYNDYIKGIKNFYFYKMHSGFGVTMPDPGYYPSCNAELADALFTIEKAMNSQNQQSRLEAFKQVAEQYRALKTKPVQTEEQRKYVVQATFFAQQKKFPQAIELYKKALFVDSTAFPIVYYDLANIYAETQSYSAAIFYMKEYLMLVPDASGARAAQDKIYEWEAIVNPPQ
ncbi:tetratricopeptide repeat protein [Microbacter margulisiae]|uniref:Tetratricopeptide (TPR) repeat protein n=1 Tax=Microbacter margulisiae TaxID=1350067 RepID=A0A7W5DNS0_9PORP|nr:tetratricopeptide repeat protein [Microbacter margulisiae]MBB3186251.1 tetratricopeptide (TPR) repeat protein [Microbacter margulisiae]